MGVQYSQTDRGTVTNPELLEAYYRTAYEHGAEAFKRGETKEQVGDHYWTSVLYADLGVWGWVNGWTDEARASVEGLWWDDASYTAYQAMP